MQLIIVYLKFWPPLPFRLLIFITYSNKSNYWLALTREMPIDSKAIYSMFRHKVKFSAFKPGEKGLIFIYFFSGKFQLKYLWCNTPSTQNDVIGWPSIQSFRVISAYAKLYCDFGKNTLIVGDLSSYFPQIHMCF